MRINVKKMRRDLGISQIEFGEKIGCAQTNVSFLEKGLRNTSQDTYDKLVSAFGVDYVMRFDEPEVPANVNAENPEDMISLLREQQRQTAELIELLRQALHKLGYRE